MIYKKREFGYLKVFWTALFLFSASAFVSSAAAQKTLQLTLDLAEFQNSSQQNYLEVYYAVAGQSNSYVPQDNGRYVCQLVMDMRIFKGDSLWASKVWKIQDAVGDTAEIAKDKQMVDMLRYFVDEPGMYRAVLFAKDINNQILSDSVTKEIEIKNFADDSLDLSDVQLASEIIRSGDTPRDVFVKGPYRVIPNPTLVFGEPNSKLYYYFEAYNLSEISNDQFKCLAYVTDSNGERIESMGSPARTKKNVHDTGVEMGILNISELPSGRYAFVYGVSDTAGTNVVKDQKTFFVYNPSVASDSQGAVQGPGAESYGALLKMTNEQLDQEYKQMLYLTSKDEREFYANLKNPEAKRQVIYNTWGSQTNGEGLTGMMYRDLYLLRVKAADENFVEPGKPGWKTDRGRVFILYGPPTNIDRIPNSPSTRPYQVWRYDNLHGQGGVEFVFADRYGFNRYELINSTLRGELQDPNWRRYVQVGGGSSQQP